VGVCSSASHEWQKRGRVTDEEVHSSPACNGVITVKVEGGMRTT
jgi:hypothetical protein